MGKTIMYEQIYSDLLNKIQRGIFAQGDKLPSEKELSEEYGVSRITSKRALDILAENQYITRSRGKGSFVTGNQGDILARNVFPEEEAILKKPLIGVVFDTFGSDFGSGLLRSIELECRKKGYDMLFRCSYGNIEEENEAIRRALQLGAKGLILMCAQGEVYNSMILQLVVDKFPMVLIDRQMKGIPIPCIKTDNYSASKKLTQILIARGHKKICFVSHSFNNTSTIHERHNGFVDGIMEHEDVNGVFDAIRCYDPASEDMVRENIHFDPSEIMKVIQKNADCSAFLIVEFQMGALFGRALKSMNLKKEIAVFDCLSEAYMDEYDFVYVKQDENSMGIKAVQTLCAVMEGKAVEDVINIPYDVIIDKSQDAK